MQRLGGYFAWLLVALLGAFALAAVALGRGEVPVCVPFTELQARDKALKAATGLGLAPTLKRIKGSRGASLLQGDSLRF